MLITHSDVDDDMLTMTAMTIFCSLFWSDSSVLVSNCQEQEHANHSKGSKGQGS